MLFPLLSWSCQPVTPYPSLNDQPWPYVFIIPQNWRVIEWANEFIHDNLYNIFFIYMKDRGKQGHSTHQLQGCISHSDLSHLVSLAPLTKPTSSENLCYLLISPSFFALRCYVDDKVSRVAWLNRSNIIFAGSDKWSLDPRVDLVTKGQLEYSLRIQKVKVTNETGPHEWTFG